MVLREVTAPRNYVALWRMARFAPELRETARRYFLGGGTYPWDCPVRTPLGVVRPLRPRRRSRRDVAGARARDRRRARVGARAGGVDRRAEARHGGAGARD